MSSEQSPVPFTKENVMKCKCGSCPIHRQSACIKELVENLGNHMEILDQDPLQKEEIPGMYCAKGRGPCDDLNFVNACMCGTCQIFNDEFLLAADKPGGYFCEGGMAL